MKLNQCLVIKYIYIVSPHPHTPNKSIHIFYQLYFTTRHLNHIHKDILHLICNIGRQKPFKLFSLFVPLVLQFD